MHPYSANTKIARTIAGHDIFHKTADLPAEGRKAAAKPAKHAARQDAKQQIRNWKE